MVIGAKGFIGAAVTRRLVAEGHAVVCVDLKATAGRLADVLDDIELLVGDVSSEEGLMSLLAAHPVDAVIGLPFYRGPSTRDQLEVMVAGTWRIFEQARLANVQRVVCASSIRVYGPQSLHGAGAVDESSPCMPQDAYGAGKRLGELAAAEFNRKYDMQIAMLRINGVYGPGVREGASGICSAPYLAATEGTVELPYIPDARLCLSHVDDNAWALTSLAIGKPPEHTVYEAGGHPTSYAEMAEITRQLVPAADIRFGTPTSQHELTYTYLTDNSRLHGEYGIAHRSVLDGYRTIVEHLAAHA